jgi:polysaccharide pyruvyl transferase WcaK-like protein
MRIGIIGWYGHDNAGDERILASLKRHFADHDLLITTGFDDAEARVAALNRCDYVLIGGGGLILRGMGRYGALVDQLTPPLSCVGISVEAVHEDNRALIDAILHKADVVYVRDSRSKVMLNDHPKVIIGPDLTFLYPFRPIELVQTESCAVNLRAWPYWTFEYNGRGDQTMRRLHARFPQLQRVYPLPQWRPEKAIAILQQKFDELLPVSLYSEPEHATDSRFLRRFFPDVADEFDATQLAQCRYVVAMRLHALIFACQMGIPFVSLTYQPKNEVFCRQLDMAHLSVPLTELDRLAAAIDVVKADPQRIREQLLEFTETQRSKGHAVMQEIAAFMPVGV